MNKHLSFFFLILLMSCGSKTTIELKQIEFDNPYKFNSEIEELFIQDSLNPDYQLAATYYALKGDETNAIKSWNRGASPPLREYTQAQKDSVAQNYMVVSARDYIVKKAEQEQIVMLNEAHHLPSHRVFANSMLKDLYDVGFEYFLVEALTNGQARDSLLSQRGYPILDSGFYTESVEFGNLLREALDIGFKVLPYETTQEMGGEIREADQAKNVTAIIEADPDSKFLIYCGAGHSVEGTIKYWGGKSLAARITENTGINPLTIDQFFQAPRGRQEYNSIFLQSLEVKTPSILLSDDNVPYRFQRGESWIDLTVLHPATSNNKDLINQDDGYKKVIVDLSVHNINYPLMVLVYNKNEPVDGGIPVQLAELFGGDASLMLPEGTYTLVLDELQGASYSYFLEVN